MLKTVRSTVNVDQITGVLPVVNGGTGVTTSTGTGSVVLSAAPTLSGNVGLSTGNLIPSTAAKGINFTANTPAAGMTSQLLNWYEEGVGTYTMTASTSGTITLNPSFNTLRYTRVGRLVTVTGHLNVDSVSSPVGILRFVGLPFTTIAGAANLSSFSVTAIGLAATAITMITGITVASSTSATIYKYVAGTVVNLAGDVQAGSSFHISLTYAI